MLFRPDCYRGDVFLPFQLELTGIAGGGDRILQVFDGRLRLLHFHIDAAQVHADIVGIAVLAGLFIDDELPVFGVLHQEWETFAVRSYRFIDLAPTHPISTTSVLS